MFTSLSQYRLRETASLLKRFKSAGKEFVILRSKTVKPIAQYYVVSSDWDNQPLSVRIEPLAHVNVTGTGKTIIQTWQPELFKLHESKQSFLSQFHMLTH